MTIIKLCSEGQHGNGDMYKELLRDNNSFYCDIASGNYAIYQQTKKRVLMTYATLLCTPHAHTKILTHMVGYQEEMITVSV